MRRACASASSAATPVSTPDAPHPLGLLRAPRAAMRRHAPPRSAHELSPPCHALDPPHNPTDPARPVPHRAGGVRAARKPPQVLRGCGHDGFYSTCSVGGASRLTERSPWLSWLMDQVQTPPVTWRFDVPTSSTGILLWSNWTRSLSCVSRFFLPARDEIRRDGRDAARVRYVIRWRRRHSTWSLVG